MSQGFLYPGGILSLPRDAAERLLREQNADATHLYLALLAREEASFLHWPRPRLDEAQAVLVRLGLLDGAAALPSSTPEKIEPEAPPEYGSADVANALGSGGDFPVLVEELQKRLGKLLSPSDLQTLLLLYDFLALPVEVILLIVTHCAQRIEKQYGPGRKPTLPQIKTEAFRWQRQGIDTYEAAEAYLRKLDTYSEAANRLLPLLGIKGRAAIPAERRYLEKWIEQGFDDGAIQLAYEKTIMKKQELSWPYLNSILRNWHQKGFHTVAEVEAGEQNRWKKAVAPAAAPVGADSNRARQDMERMERLLAQRDASNKEG